jgi:hypothetical protein
LRKELWDGIQVVGWVELYGTDVKITIRYSVRASVFDVFQVFMDHRSLRRFTSSTMNSAQSLISGILDSVEIAGKNLKTKKPHRDEGTLTRGQTKSLKSDRKGRS